MVPTGRRSPALRRARRGRQRAAGVRPAVGRRRRHVRRAARRRPGRWRPTRSPRWPAPGWRWPSARTPRSPRWTRGAACAPRCTTTTAGCPAGRARPALRRAHRAAAGGPVRRDDAAGMLAAGAPRDLRASGTTDRASARSLTEPGAPRDRAACATRRQCDGPIWTRRSHRSRADGPARGAEARARPAGGRRGAAAGRAGRPSRWSTWPAPTPPSSVERAMLRLAGLTGADPGRRGRHPAVGQPARRRGPRAGRAGARAWRCRSGTRCSPAATPTSTELAAEGGAGLGAVRAADRHGRRPGRPGGPPAPSRVDCRRSTAAARSGTGWSSGTATRRSRGST